MTEEVPERREGDQRAKRDFSFLKWEVFIAFIVPLVIGIYGYGQLNARVQFLENQNNKGERFTASEGAVLAGAMRELTKAVADLNIWRARIDEHVNAHETNAQRWINQIEKNTAMTTENNLMLHKILARQESRHKERP